MRNTGVPGQGIVSTIHRILRYLKGVPGQGIVHKGHGHVNGEEYSDAYWPGSQTCWWLLQGFVCSLVDSWSHE